MEDCVPVLMEDKIFGALFAFTSHVVGYVGEPAYGGEGIEGEKGLELVRR